MVKLNKNFEINIVRFFGIGLLSWFLFIFPAVGQVPTVSIKLKEAQTEFNNGNFTKAIELATQSIEAAKAKNDDSSTLKGLSITTYSQISLDFYDSAENSIKEALILVDVGRIPASEKADIYFCASWFYRSRHQLTQSFEFANKALAVDPKNPLNKSNYDVNVGRILFSAGFDLSAIIWLQKAEAEIKRVGQLNYNDLEAYRYLSLAWASKADFQNALKYAEKFTEAAAVTKFKFKYRQALFEWGSLLSATGQKRKAFEKFEKGLQLAITEKDKVQSRVFLNSLVLNNLDNGDPAKASDYLEQLEKLDTDGKFGFEILLGKAVIDGLEKKTEESEKKFNELAKMEEKSVFLIPGWRAIVAEKLEDWEKVIKYNKELFDVTEKYNFRDDLPAMYLTFAKAYFHLKDKQNALANLQKSISLIEEFRLTNNNQVSLGLYETYHDAYRLLTWIRADNPQESFELADFLKARFLKDKINNVALNSVPVISQEIKQKLEALTLKYVEDKNVEAEIKRIEKSATSKIPEVKLNKPDLSALDRLKDLSNTAVISYFFTPDKNLIAFVWENGKLLRNIQLQISEDEVNQTATKTQEDIKNRVFFKRDGKRIFDILLAPLSLNAKHLIIIPDKSLWKIPFQALSSNGEKYLIEEKLISYSPSISILLEQLQNLKPNRKTLQAFANSSFENRVLQNVNNEAITAAGIYNSQPVINATVGDFERAADKADILHFSMHAEVSNDQPLDSFLGFRKFGKDDGRFTVEKILNIKLKKGSLVFLASCDTNNVLNGEGLVSLAWAMMGAGATTIVSSQWEANDKSTLVFTSNFYKYYKQGSSAAEAVQKAALELINNKSNDIHEPYYWADFALTGDFR